MKRVDQQDHLAAILAKGGKQSATALARASGLERKSVIRILGRMEEVGRIIVERARAGAPGHPCNTYRLKDVELTGCAAEALNEIMGTRGSYQWYEHNRDTEGMTAREISDADPNRRVTDNAPWYVDAYNQGVSKDALLMAEYRTVWVRPIDRDVHYSQLTVFLPKGTEGAIERRIRVGYRPEKRLETLFDDTKVSQVLLEEAERRLDPIWSTVGRHDTTQPGIVPDDSDCPF